MIRFGVPVLLLFLVSAVGRSQDNSPPHPLQPADTSSPAATLDSLVNACNELQALVGSGAVTDERAGEVLPTTERMLDCLDLGELPKELRNTAGIESAIFLKEVFDRIDLPARDAIPAVEVTPDGTVSPDQWQLPGTRITIQHVTEGPSKDAYLVSPETVRRAAEFYRMVKPLPYRSDGRAVSPGLYDAYIAATKKQPTRTADTSSPRGTLTLFLDSCNELYEAIGKQRYFDREDPDFRELAARIIACLDTSELPEYAREYFDAEAAVCLKEILDRVPLPPDEAIPGIESVESGDGAEPLLRWQIPRTQIVIGRIDEGPRRGEYLFTAGTVSRAPELFDKVRIQPYRSTEREVSQGFYQWWLSSPGDPLVAAWVDRLPPSFQNRVFGMAIWQWTGLAIGAPLCLVVMFLLIRWASVHGERVRERSLLQFWLVFAVLVLTMLIPIAFKYFAWDYLTLRATPIYVVNFCSDLIFLLGVLGLIVGGSSRLAETMIALPMVAPEGLDANLIRIICRVLGIAAAVIVMLEGGRYLGFPLTTLIASAGIGGLAVALSAQGLIKGLFGTVTILMDKPYRVGERIVVKGHDGFVEEIGLRSTKIRALTNHVISIPNDQMADAEIENIGKRDFIRRTTDLHIPLDTPRKKVQQALECVRRTLENHQGMDPQFPPRVFFSEIAPDAYTIQMNFWFTPPDLWKFMEESERVNLEIFASFEELGIQFSLPFRHTYWKQDDRQGPLEVSLSNHREPSEESPMTEFSD